ncbi:MAG: Peroxiredoxin OsmC [Myxococcaceae bacterium]|nr:Peroxiredoxin OsmC [Myxococcaceae bacterium]
MSVSKASAEWNGSLKKGTGSMTPAHAPAIAFSLGTRFEGQQGSNPEELIGAALSGCFSMALAGALGKEGLEPTKIETTASVTLDKDEVGFAITKIELTTRVAVPGVDQVKFEHIARATKESCPVSKALLGTTITVDAQLV